MRIDKITNLKFEVIDCSLVTIQHREVLSIAVVKVVSIMGWKF